MCILPEISHITFCNRLMMIGWFGWLPGDLDAGVMWSFAFAQASQKWIGLIEVLNPWISPFDCASISLFMNEWPHPWCIRSDAIAGGPCICSTDLSPRQVCDQPVIHPSVWLSCICRLWIVQSIDHVHSLGFELWHLPQPWMSRCIPVASTDALTTGCI